MILIENWARKRRRKSCILEDLLFEKILQIRIISDGLTPQQLYQNDALQKGENKKEGMLDTKNINMPHNISICQN